MSETIITPWTVQTESRFEYDRLIEQFGLKPITVELVKRFERVTGVAAHKWIRRGIVFAHQGLEEILDHYEAGKQIYIYTGRGPSNKMHLGHLLPFELAKYLQDAFHAVVVIQMADEEKFYFKESLTKEQIQSYLEDNVKDIIACGFDPRHTFIFSNFEYAGRMHHLASRIMRMININQLKHIYGFTDSDSLGRFYWPVQQICPAFPEAFPRFEGKDIMCLVPLAIDQTPYFRVARDLAERLGFHKPAIICSKFLMGLDGEGEKMSSTGTAVDKTIYLSDDASTVASKIKRYAFSGGQKTLKLHRELGGNTKTDVSFQYLCHFEDLDELLQTYEEEYAAGRMLTGELKNCLIKVLEEYLGEHQKRKAAVTGKTIEEFMEA